MYIFGKTMEKVNLNVLKTLILNIDMKCDYHFLNKNLHLRAILLDASSVIHIYKKFSSNDMKYARTVCSTSCNALMI